MALEKMLNARFALKIDTYANWTDETLGEGKGALCVLKRGEVGFCEIPAGSAEATTAPTILFKVGDGTSPFKSLKWASALAADVYGWAKKTEAEFMAWVKELVPVEVIDDGKGKFVTDVTVTNDANGHHITITRADVEWDDIQNKPNLGVMSVEGKDAIVATGDKDVEVSLKIAEGEGKVGNVTLSQSADGLKAEYDLVDGLEEFGITKTKDEHISFSRSIDGSGFYGIAGHFTTYVDVGESLYEGPITTITSTEITVQGKKVATEEYVGEQIEAAVEDLAVKNVSDTAVDKQFVTAIGLDTDGNVVATRAAIDGDDIADAVGTYGITTTEIETTNIVARGTLGVYGETTFSRAVKKVETIDGQSNIYEVATERFATAAATTAQTAAEANAKAYVDSEDIFETDMNTINALGGIGANVNLNGLTTHEVLKKLLYPYVDASVGNATASPNNGGTFEKGSTKAISSVSITVTKKSEPITSVALYDGTTAIETKTDVANGGTITFSNVNKSVTSNGGKLTVKVTYPDAAGVAKTVSKETGAFTFISPYWYGVCGAADEINADLVLGLTKDLTAKGTKTYSYTTEAQRMVIAYPSSYGKIKLVKDGNGLDNTGAFGQPITVSVTSALGVTEEYYVYANGVTSGSAKMTFSY